MACPLLRVRPLVLAAGFLGWLLALVAPAVAQNAPPLTPPPAGATISAPPLTPPPTAAPRRTAAPATPAEGRDLTPTAAPDVRPGLKMTKGTGTLPNDAGQVWREYDLTPYTSRIKDSERPQQAVVDWVLRETGTDVWFSEPLGILSASNTTLRVYHTPAMQQTVRGIVERLIASGDEAHVLGVRLATVGSPDWRARSVSLLKPIDVKQPGVEAWLLSRENAALLYESLQNRADFRAHSAPQVEIFNGQTQKLARTQPKSYSRGVQPRADGLGYELIPGQIEEGYSLELSPLLSLDGKTVEAAIRCQVDQIERMVPVAIDVPVVGQGSRVQIQVPQLVSWRLVERFRWPTDQVLLLSCGVVANPGHDANSTLARLNPFGGGGQRADALLFVEHRGAAGQVTTTTAPTPPASGLLGVPNPLTGRGSLFRSR
ncbi:MAG: hypothetical protein SFU86_14835 [Pirellulaceae bacterium]|nr:hypothetical protein [Pirellulaceae bacterium]